MQTSGLLNGCVEICGNCIPKGVKAGGLVSKVRILLAFEDKYIALNGSNGSVNQIKLIINPALRRPCVTVGN